MMSTEPSFEENVHQQANDSIIKKVKSRVSNIFPSVVSWFSSSEQATNNNGSVRRRRESESDEEEDDGNEQNLVDSQPKFKRRKSDVTTSHHAVAGPSNIDRRRSMPLNSMSTPTQYNLRNRHIGLSQQIKTSSPYDFASRNPQMSIMASPIQVNDSSDDDDNEEAGETDEVQLVQEESPVKSINKRKGIHDGLLRINSSESGDRSTSEPPGVRTMYKSPNLNFSYEESRAITTGRRQGHGLQNQVILENDDDTEGEAEVILNGNDAGSESGSERLFQRGDMGREDASSGSERRITGSENNLIHFPQPSTSRQQQYSDGRLSGFLGNRNKTMSASTGELSFQAHLETDKSLFSERNALNRRSFNPSVYGSSWSLNSAASQNRYHRTLSPFYGGKTIYGGASAYSRREHRLQQTLRVPTMIRPSSSLSNASSNSSLTSGDGAMIAQSNTGLSNTSKRILELLNQCTSPLKDARKMGTGLNTSIRVPTLMHNRSRFTEEDLNLSRASRIQCSKTPYSRPTPALPPTNELQVPSISQLLQMKKRLQSSTEQVRKLATESKNTLNETTEYTLPAVNSQNSTESNGVKHINKVKNKITGTRASEKNTQLEMEKGPSQVNLPNIEFPVKSVPKIDLTITSTATTTIQSSLFTTKPPAITNSKPTNSFMNEARPVISKPISTTASTTVITSKQSQEDSRFTFSSPVPIPSKQVPNAVSTRNFTFSKPLPFNGITEPIPKMLEFKFDANLAKKKNGEDASPKPTPSGLSMGTAPKQLKQGSCLDALSSSKKIDESPVKPAVSGFGSQFKMTSNQWECSVCMIRNNEAAGKCVACETPKPGAKINNNNNNNVSEKKTTLDVGFKSIVEAQKAKWSCPTCMSQNDQSADKCLACCEPKPGGSKEKVEKPQEKLATTDDGFKKLVAQQNAKWSCSTCLTLNEQTRTKCAACEQAKPGSAPEKVPQFSFGSSSGKFSFGVPPAQPQEKPQTDGTKSGFVFGTQNASTNASPKTGFIFGASVKPANSSETTNVSKPTGFTFGAVPASSTITASPSSFVGSDSAQTVSSSTTSGLTFGSKPDTVSNPVESSSAVNKRSLDETDQVAKISKAEDNSSGASKPLIFGKTNEAQAKPTITFGATSQAVSSSGFSFAKPTAPVSAIVKPDTKKEDSFVSSTMTVTTSTTSTPTFGTSVSGIKPLDRSAFTIKPATSSSEEKQALIFGAAKKDEGIKPTVGGFTFGQSTKPADASIAVQPATSSIFGNIQPKSQTDSPKGGFSFVAAAQTSTSKDETKHETTSSSIPTFGSFSSPKTTTAASGFSFGTIQKPETTKPVMSTFGSPSIVGEPEKKTSIFGSISSGSSITSSTSPFAFGASSANNNSPSLNQSNPTTVQPPPPPAYGTQPTNAAFGTPSPSTFATPVPSGTPAFASSGSSASSIFGGSTTPFNQPPNTNTALPSFGSPSGFGSAVNQSPIFGASNTSSPFRSGNTGDESSNKRLNTGFGFNSAESNTASSTSSGNAPFMFGNTPASDNNNSKPAFNFSPAVKPSFNFTDNQGIGSNSTAPFQFGAPVNVQPTPGVFTFGATPIVEASILLDEPVYKKRVRINLFEAQVQEIEEYEIYVNKNFTCEAFDPFKKPFKSILKKEIQEEHFSIFKSSLLSSTAKFQQQPNQTPPVFEFGASNNNNATNTFADATAQDKHSPKGRLIGGHAAASQNKRNETSIPVKARSEMVWINPELNKKPTLERRVKPKFYINEIQTIINSNLNANNHNADTTNPHQYNSSSSKTWVKTAAVTTEPELTTFTNKTETTTFARPMITRMWRKRNPQNISVKRKGNMDSDLTTTSDNSNENINKYDRSKYKYVAPNISTNNNNNNTNNSSENCG